MTTPVLTAPDTGAAVTVSTKAHEHTIASLIAITGPLPFAVKTARAADLLGMSPGELKKIPFDVLPYYRGADGNGRDRSYDTATVLALHVRRMREAIAGGPEPVRVPVPTPPGVARAADDDGTIPDGVALDDAPPPLGVAVAAMDDVEPDDFPSLTD